MPPKLRIQLHSNQIYHPGSTVTGSLLLDTDEPKSYKQILVQLTGRCYCRWRIYGNPMGQTHSTSHEPYFDSFISLWDSQQSPDGKLPPGQYNWPFTFVIPASVPSSFEGKFGNIRYMLMGRIVTGALKHNHDVMTVIPVQQLLQITDPRLLQPVRTEVQKTVGCLCCTSQPIVLTVAVPKTGFCIGDSIQLHISLENGSNRQLTLTVNLKEQITFIASGNYRKRSKSLYTFRSNEINHQEAADLDKAIIIPKADTNVLHSKSCRNIKVAHWIEVTCHIPWAFNLSTTIRLQFANCSE